MNLKAKKIIFQFLTVSIMGVWFSGCSEAGNPEITDKTELANHYYGNDAAWYLDNIPFFECSDKTIEEVYYYRWQLYKAHIRNIGNREYVITEFIDDVSWDRDPYSSIIAAAGHQIYEGRWLKDNRYLDGYINYLYQHGGNDRKYSEAIADATYARYLVNANGSFVTSQLDSMIRIFEAWDDHFDSSKGLYYITPNNDATEYSIASLGASGGKDGWGGEAFRPTINSYMAANALAISQIAALKGDVALNNRFAKNASMLTKNLMSLWNDTLQHFTDRYKVENQYVRYWDFIEDRELAGYVPWMYNLPDNQPACLEAWKHLTDTTKLMGQYGLRTVEPSYRYYMKQYRINADGSYDCQWNGPSWPYQTCQVLTAAANLLNNYVRDVIVSSDYLHLLRQYARQHYLPNGTLNLQEDYNPDTGKPIVGLDRSHHYLHSTFNDLVITGLCGLQPSDGDTLVIAPIVDNSIGYFRLSDVLYHGHKLTVVYDIDGSRYKLGKGLTVFVDGKQAKLTKANGKNRIEIGAPVLPQTQYQPSNYALNIRKEGYPAPSASINSAPDSLNKAIDGRIIYFPEVKNWWSTLGSKSETDWYAVDFGGLRDISSVGLYFFADGKTYDVPADISIEYRNDELWLPVKVRQQVPETVTGNTANRITFEEISAKQVKINLKRAANGKAMAVTEVECN